MTTPHPSPTRAVRTAYQRIAVDGGPNVWITLLDEEVALERAREVEDDLARGEQRPLAGYVFAVKDNIDVAGLPTTAAHPAFSHVAERTATAVQRLLDAGAVLVGKTNLDQFATGLVGTRSPYGVVRSAADPERVSGGSSAGSGAAVGAGLVDFAVGTDTAGSGRVPAAFNGVIGIKPTLGLVPADGVLPACPSYDTATVFARDLALAATVTRTMAGPSDLDAHSRPWPASAPLAAPERPVLGVPRAEDLGALSPALREAFAAACRRAESTGAVLREVDLTVFLRAARLLYDGGLVAERAYSFGRFLAENPDGADPSVAAIAERAGRVSGVDVVADQQQLLELTAAGRRILDGVTALLLPTAPEHPTVEAVQAEPLAVNARLGTYTNFVNLMDMAAVAVPAAHVPGEGLFGVSVVTRAFEDQVAIDLAARLLDVPTARVFDEAVPLAVFGAHLRGQPLNTQLQALGARFDGPISTTGDYRMHALPGTPAKPLVSRAAAGTGAELPGELWLLSTQALGELLTTLPSPLALGRVHLSDGRQVLGFTGQPTGHEEDITASGGWLAHLAARSGPVDTPDAPGADPALQPA
ncbi:allophanate hydrolase [Kineococcus sp. SYSU DK018]|uniref:allophanate hydrolase n=1 Tax=Kineococcus sp. SYSU DK018 TaxID=3383139 RepID=UPI003D7E11CB